MAIQRDFPACDSDCCHGSSIQNSWISLVGISFVQILSSWADKSSFICTSDLIRRLSWARLFRWRSHYRKIKVIWLLFLDRVPYWRSGMSYHNAQNPIYTGITLPPWPEWEGFWAFFGYRNQKESAKYERRPDNGLKVENLSSPTIS